MIAIRSFPPVGFRAARVHLVDFAREPVPVENRLRDHPGRDRVTDTVQPADPGGGECRLIAGQLVVQGVQRFLLGDEHDPVAAAAPGLSVAVVAGDRSGVYSGDGRSVPDSYSRPVEVGTEHVTLQRLVADRRENVEY